MNPKSYSHTAPIAALIARPIDNGWYRVSDRQAAALSGNAKALPSIGCCRKVQLPGGWRAWLQRTPYSLMVDAPKRGWIWAIYSLRHETELG